MIALIGATHSINLFFTPDGQVRTKEQQEKHIQEMTRGDVPLDGMRARIEIWDILKNGPLFFLTTYNIIKLNEFRHWTQFAGPFTNLLSILFRFYQRGN